MPLCIRLTVKTPSMQLDRGRAMTYETTYTIGLEGSDLDMHHLILQELAAAATRGGCLTVAELITPAEFKRKYVEGVKAESAAQPTRRWYQFW